MHPNQKTVKKQLVIMKSIRNIALGVLMGIAAFSAIMYSSCSKTKDACSGVTCNHGGTCASGNCTCTIGYAGIHCDSVAFLGQWQGVDSTGSTRLGQITMTIANNSTDTALLNVTNLGGSGTTNITTVSLSADKRSLTYSNFVFVVDSTTNDTLSGTITLTDNTHFKHVYTIRETGAGQFTAIGNYTKL